VKTSVDWDNAATEDGLFSVYWERQNLLPCQKYTFGVSFPKEYIPEFPSFLILPLFMITTLLAVIVYRRKHTR